MTCTDFQSVPGLDGIDSWTPSLLLAFARHYRECQDCADWFNKRAQEAKGRMSKERWESSVKAGEAMGADHCEKLKADPESGFFR